MIRLIQHQGQPLAAFPGGPVNRTSAAKNRMELAWSTFRLGFTIMPSCIVLVVVERVRNEPSCQDRRQRPLRLIVTCDFIPFAPCSYHTKLGHGRVQ
jgi:hypothetical protein